MLRYGLAPIIALAFVLCTMTAPPAQAPVANAAELRVGPPGMYVKVPRDLPAGKPAQVLVVLHGMGGNGEQFASHLARDAERNHWVLVAPTIAYGDWTDPAQIAREDPRLIRWLADYLDHLQEFVGVPVMPRVLLLGHSRGAQLAHRFALFEPRRVLAVAALAAGTYTLPLDRTATGAMISFPFGIGDLNTVAGHDFSRIQLVEDTEFWLGVGTEDNTPGDLPRAWDPFLGTTRVQRARVFHEALRGLGARSVLVAFRGERHGLSPAMASSACSFLRMRALDVSRSASAQSNGSPVALRSPRARAHF
jgi:pimeloyl-ACP methyl ester carboxylesterase